MNELNSIESNSIEISLNDQTKFRLNEINKIKSYFNAEIKARELITRKLSKYIAFCDYTDKILIVLSASTGSISIASFVVIGDPAGIASASFTLIFSLTTGIIKKLLKITRKKKKKHNSKCKFYFNIFFDNRNNKEITENNKKEEEKAQ